MVIGCVDLNNLDEIKKFIHPVITKVRKEYYFIDIDEHIIDTIAIDTIKMLSKKYNFNEIDLRDTFKKEYIENLDEYIKSITDSNEISKNMLTKYIEKTARRRKSTLENIKVLYAICDFALKYNLNLVFEDYECFINGNSELKEMLCDIVKANSDLIKSDKIDTYITNEIALEFIQAYCYMNGIVFEDDAFDDDEIIKKLLKYQKNSEYSDDTLKQYINSIKAPILTAQEEKELFIRLSKGDSFAREIIVERNLRLVLKVANRYKKNNMDFLDIVQDGNIGLLTAVNRFDYTRGTKFSTYAMWWIRQEITRAIGDRSRIIRIPIHYYEKIKALTYKQNLFISQNGREPTIEETAEMMDTTVKHVEEMYRYLTNAVSLNVHIGEEEESELGDIIESDEITPEEDYLRSEIYEQLKEMFELCNLSDKEIFVLKHRFGLDNFEVLTLEQVGKKLHVTRERVRQIQAKAMRKLKCSRFASKLKCYLSEYPVIDDKYTQENCASAKKLLNRSNARKTKSKATVGGMSTQPLTLLELLSYYSKDDILKAMEYLTSNERKLVTDRFGEDLDCVYEVNNWEFAAKNIFHNNILPKIKKILCKVILNNDTKNKVIYSQPSKINTERTSIEKTSIDIKNENINGEGEFEMQTDCNKVIGAINTISMNNMLSSLEAKELTIISLRLGLFNNKAYSSSEIAKILNISEIDVINITKKVLLAYRKSINDYIGETMNDDNERLILIQ